jgi:hypothetical protein
MMPLRGASPTTSPPGYVPLTNGGSATSVVP